MKLDVIVVGAAGRMGQEILVVLKQQKHARVFATVDPSGAADHRDIHEVHVPSRKSQAIVIDFSSPRGFLKSLRWCQKNKVAIVSGTTGIAKGQIRALKVASKKIPVLWSPNMSVGINIMNEVIREFGRTLRRFDLQIEEIHHCRKKDAPSGTALMLQKTLRETTDKTLLPPLSIRGGGVFGVHKLWAMSENEILTLEHTALNRQVFAAGAVMAAMWLSQKKKGLYEFRDILK